MIEPFPQPIYVTKPFLPPFEAFMVGAREIWDSGWLTNGGPVLQQYHSALEAYFATSNLSLFVNGTLALQIGLHALQLKGEVITTPFTFVATAHSLWWNNLTPVFVDIESDYYTLDPAAVEAAITPNTSAILAVHVFGHPCNLEALAAIARRHHLCLVYDAAHAFGVTAAGRSIAHYGDMSMFSFHATKLYQSIEGGLLVFGDSSLKGTVNQLKNFGIVSEEEIVGHGTNAKMNELQALMGMLVLPHIDEIIDTRARISNTYRERLASLSGIHFPPLLPPWATANYAYMPIEIDEAQAGISRDLLYERLKRYNIYARRYFYPLLTACPCYHDAHTPDGLLGAQRIARQILTLPLYYDLSLEQVHRICDILTEILDDPSA